MKTKIILSSIFVIILLTIGGWLAYPQFIVWLYGDGWPNSWNAELYNLNHRQIVEKIGQPSEDASAKEYQSWLKKEAWVEFQLKIGFEGCCDDRSKPSSIYKIVRVKDRYEPALYIRLPSPPVARSEMR